MSTVETSAFTTSFLTLPFAIGIMGLGRVLAPHTFEVLRANYTEYYDKGELLTHRDIIEHLATASLASTTAVDDTRLNVIKEVFLIAVTAKALRGRSDGFAIHTGVHVPPVNVKSILTCISYLVFVLLEFLVAHHDASVSVSDNIVIFNVGVNMFASH
jgi:hypothetical protein